MKIRFQSVLARTTFFAVTVVLASQVVWGQQATVVPTLVNFSGTIKDVDGKPLSGTVGVTFLLYKEESSGAPLWLETQNVTPDEDGHYSAMLGSTRTEGLPTDVFISGEARWLAVEVQGQPAQPRVLLLSVPYALKAGDAQTVGGLPASAFVMAAAVAPASSNSPISGDAATTSAVPAASSVTTTGGTANTIPLFTTATNIQNSILTQTGATAVNVAGKLNMPSNGIATAAGGKVSRPELFVASAFNSGTSTAVPQTFQLMAEPTGNNTPTPAATLDLLFGSGTAAPTETGVKISSKGLITFATGQKFPGTGDGTVSSIATGTGLTGGPIKTTGTISLDTSVVPLLAAPNFFANSQIIQGSPATYGLVVTQSNQQGLLLEAPEGSVGAALDFLTTGGGGLQWEVLNTGAGSSQGANKLNFRNVNTSTDIMTLTAAGPVGIGTIAPSAQLEVDSSSASVGAIVGTANSLRSAISGTNSATGAAGVSGSDVQGFGFSTDSNVTQARGMGGWAKAMVYVQIGTGIVRCFNSQLGGNAASTPPCGLTFTYNSSGDYTVDFGFEVDDRFPSMTSESPFEVTAETCRGPECFNAPDSHQINVIALTCDGNFCGGSDLQAFTLIIF